MRITYGMLRLRRHGLRERRDLLCRIISIKVFLDQLGELGIDRAHFCGSVEMRLWSDQSRGRRRGCAMLWGRREMFRGYAVCSLGLAKHLLDWAGVHTGRSAAAETMAAAVAAAAAAEVVAEAVAAVEAAAVAVVAVAAAELGQSASVAAAEAAAAWAGLESIAAWPRAVGNS